MALVWRTMATNAQVTQLIMVAVPLIPGMKMSPSLTLSSKCPIGRGRMSKEGKGFSVMKGTCCCNTMGYSWHREARNWVTSLLKHLLVAVVVLGCVGISKEQGKNRSDAEMMEGKIRFNGGMYIVVLVGCQPI